jgi:hypothetical protein
VTAVNDAGWNDDHLLAELRDALAARRAVPPAFIEAGRNAFAWHDIDAELAQLTYDSTRGSELAAVTRTDTASIRALTFTSARLKIEFEVTGDSVLGQVVPPQVASIELQALAGTVITMTSDEIGCFSIHPVPPGPFRLRFRAPGGIDVLTGWITLSESGGA